MMTRLRKDCFFFYLRQIRLSCLPLCRFFPLFSFFFLFLPFFFHIFWFGFSTYTGWVAQSWTTFSSPLVLPFGGLWAQRLATTERRWSKLWYKWWGGGWRTPWGHRDHLLPSPHSEFCTGQQYFKIWEDLSNSKNMVFNGKKLLNDNVDLTLRGRNRKKGSSGVSGWYCGFRLQITNFCPRVCQRSCLPRAFETECTYCRSRGHILMENTFFGQFSAGPHRQNHRAPVGRILNFGGLTASFLWWRCSLGLIERRPVSHFLHSKGWNGIVSPGIDPGYCRLPQSK